MQLFFSDDLQSDFCTLSQEESKHIVKVLRMRVGDEVCLTDGCGTLCRGSIVVADGNACQVAVAERFDHYGRRPFYLHLAVAPTKNPSRVEWMVEKAVEMGVDEITPVLCHHSERHTLNTARLDKIVLSAMKQSLKAYRPVVNDAVTLADFVARHPFPDDAVRLVCHCDGERQGLRQVYRAGDPVVVLIGPEGDFSPDEITSARAEGFKPVTLGDCRLRTETAALYAVTALNFMNS